MSHGELCAVCYNAMTFWSGKWVGTRKGLTDFLSASDFAHDVFGDWARKAGVRAC